MDSKDKEITEIKHEFDNLISIVFQTKEEKEYNRIDELERYIFKILMKIGKRLIILYVNQACSKENKVIGFLNKGLFSRTYFSIFGQISFKRKKLYSKESGQTIYPADISLGIPKEEYSYNLQDWIGLSATDMDFRSSVELINRILGHEIKEMQAERIVNKLSEEVEVFYEIENKLQKEEGIFFAAGFDDKGIPILPTEVNREVDSSGVRLGKGQKKMGLRKVVQ